jgi:hypothetical protein
VELREGDKLHDTKDLTLLGGEQQQLELIFQATTAGRRSLTVHILPQPEESEPLRVNNTVTTSVQVSEQKLKVLYLEGQPRWDFRFLKNAMQRDRGLDGRFQQGPDIRLEAELRRLPADQQAVALPQTLEQMAEYHTIILGDVSPRLLTPAFLDLIDQAVRDRGVGLIVEAGPNGMPFAFGEKLHMLLPVRPRLGVAGIEPHPAKPFRVELTPEGALEEALRFHDDPARNKLMWQHMPTFWWCAASERTAPGATVLAVNPGFDTRQGKLPLIAHHFAGQGRVMFVGTDSTWTWRQNVGDRFFYKFWGQSIRFVARRDGSEANNPQPTAKSAPDIEEFRHPEVNRAALEQWASLSGGRLVELPDIGKLSGWLAGESQRTALHIEQSLWDNWLMVVLIVALFSCDIGLRRLTGLS